LKKKKKKKNKKKNDKNNFFEITYVTDVEGNLDYWHTYVKRSKVVYFDSNGELEFFKPEHQYFVFGGDTCDKGIGDIRFCKLLVNFKKKYPKNVFLILGNRDINKMRLSSELSDSDLKFEETLKIPGQYWQDTPSSPKQWLEKKLEKLKSEGNNTVTLQDLNTKLERLHWMLSTLGCEDTFEKKGGEN